VNGCDGSASTTAPSGAQDCACGSLAKGPGYGYHDAPGNFEYLGRWADLAKRRQPDRDFVAHPAITATQRTTAAAGPTDGPVTARGRCVGIAVHLGATDEDETLLAAPRREADHLGVPVWLYCDRGLWTDRQLQLLRPGDVAVRQAYRGADNPRDGTREEFKASIRQAETTGHAIALVRRNFRGAGMNVALGDILESHEDLSQLVAEHPRIIADTSFCRAPAARGGPLMYPVLDRVMAKIAEGSTGTPSLTPVAPRLLTLLASPTTGPAPLEVAFTVHEPATGAAFDPASVEFWTSRAGAPLHRHTPKPGHLNLLELREPGHWLVEARVHSSVGRTSDRVAITVAPPPTRKTAKDKSAVYAGVAAAAVAFFSLFRKKKKDTKEPQ
jgi:hypothetical protein